MYSPVTGSISCSDWKMTMAVMRMTKKATSKTAISSFHCFFITETIYFPELVPKPPNAV